MPDDNLDISVRFGATTGDLSAKIALAKAELADLTAEAKALAASMASAGQTANASLVAALSSVTAEAEATAARLAELEAANAAVSAGFEGITVSSRAAQEGLRGFVDLAVDAPRRASTEFLRMAIAIGQANPELVGLGAAALAVAGTIGYLAYQQYEFNEAVKKLEIGNAINQITMTGDQLNTLIEDIKTAADVSSGDAQKIVAAFQQFGDAAGPLAELTKQYLPGLIERFGSAEKAAEYLAKQFSDLSTKGRAFVADTKGIGDQLARSWDEATDPTQKYAVILKALDARLGPLAQSTNETKTETSAYMSAIMAMGAGAETAEGVLNALAISEQAQGEAAKKAAADTEFYTSALNKGIDVQKEYRVGLQLSAKINVDDSKLKEAQQELAKLQETAKHALEINDTGGLGATGDAITKTTAKIAELQQKLADPLGRDALGQLTAQLKSIGNEGGSSLARLNDQLKDLQTAQSGPDLNPKQQADVAQQIADKKREIAAEALATEKAQASLSEAEDNKNYALKIQHAKDYWQQVLAADGAGSKEEIEAHRQVIEAQNAAAGGGKGARQALEGALATDNAIIESSQKVTSGILEQLNLQLKSHQITEAQWLAQTKDALNRESGLVQSTLQDELNQSGLTATQIAEIRKKMADEQIDSARKVMKAEQEAADATKKQWDSAFGSINSAITGQVDAVLKDSESMSQAFAHALGSMIEDAAKAGLDKLLTGAENMGEKALGIGVVPSAAGGAAGSTATLGNTTALGITTASLNALTLALGGSVPVTAANTAATAASATATSTGAASTLANTISTDANTIATNFQAAVAAIGSLFGFATGTPLVQQTGLALIHQNEMIVPADLNPNNPGNSLGQYAPSDAFRRIANGGVGGGSGASAAGPMQTMMAGARNNSPGGGTTIIHEHHYHGALMDAQSVTRAVVRHQTYNPSARGSW